MKLSKSIKPISYLKAHAAEIISDFDKKSSTLIITQNGEAKAVLQDIKQYEANQDSIALLKILALSASSVAQGHTKAIRTVFADIRKKIKDEE